MKDPIIILGFGRSGTTWISDIISKSLGGLILFEPFHPHVCEKAIEVAYTDGVNQEVNNVVSEQIDRVLGKEIRNKWLLRNHISSDLDQVGAEFISSIWDECRTIGIKSIRLNFVIPFLHSTISKKIIYIRRDPHSVIASLGRRPRFWDEFGFDVHESIIRNLIRESTDLVNLLDTCRQQYEKETFFWALTDTVAQRHMTSLGLPVFEYKDFYLKPYDTTRQLLKYLGVESDRLHPSYLFTPSMLTLKTYHELSDDDNFAGKSDMSVFWKNDLTSDQVMRISEISTQVFDILK